MALLKDLGLKMEGENPFYIIINSLSKGGAERIAADFGFYLVEKGYRPIYLLVDDAEVDYKLPEESVIRKLPFSRISRTFLFVFSVFFQAVYLRYFLKKNSKVISFLHRANMVNAFSCVLSSRRLVVSERSIYDRSYTGVKKTIIGAFLKIVFWKADSIIAISKVVKNSIMANFSVAEDKIAIIHNPIDLNSFPIKDFNSDYGGAKFCYVGRLVESKRVAFVIKIFSSIKKAFPNAKLEIIGDGYLYNDLVSLVDEAGMSSDVNFLGKVDDVGSCLRDNDFFLFASSYESFGNVALEAVSSGLPVIYTENLNSFRELFQLGGQLALSIPDHNVDDSVSVILKFIKEFCPNSYIAEREIFIKKFSRETLFEKYLDQVVR